MIGGESDSGTVRFWRGDESIRTRLPQVGIDSAGVLPFLSQPTIKNFEIHLLASRRTLQLRLESFILQPHHVLMLKRDQPRDENKENNDALSQICRSTVKPLFADRAPRRPIFKKFFLLCNCPTGQWKNPIEIGSANATTTAE
ncbi:unnamed protein product [Linum trigynum]|uniref:Uncharacterized protein n=1 Tax=Linum trigynum TaxID=586398 RepID=A0AAV2FU76_9ROSI